ncbi:MAG: hypothetical protein O2968_04410 [Acidobacteria bacterium]|nr:hypothetical protein [Acidobacteriota bacterium]
MSKFSRMPACVLFLVLAATLCEAQNHAVLFPSGGSSTVTLLDAEDLSPAGTIAGTSTARQFLATPSGDRYYILSRTSTDAIVIANPRTLEVLRRVSLSVGVSDAALSPNGQYLLVVAGQLHIFSTTTDQEIVDPIAVGSGPTQVRVDQRSRRAYVLSGSGQEIRAIDLESFEEVALIEAPTLSSIGLLETANRLVALDSDGLRLYDLKTLDQVGRLDSLFPIINGIIHPIPGSNKVAVHNRGSSPNSTSQVFDIVQGKVTTIGVPASSSFRQLTLVSAEKAFGILNEESDVAEVDLTTSPSATVTPLGLGIEARDLVVSPNGRILYATSLSQSRAVRYDTETSMTTNNVEVAVSPGALAAGFGPTGKPPAILEPLSGENQFFPPGGTTPFAMAVRVRDEDGVPLFDVPVVFASPLSSDVIFDSPQPVRTNENGIAAVNATFLAPIASTTAPDRSAASSEIEKGAPPEQPIDVIPVTATTSGGLSTVFLLNIIRVTGINIVSGNFQITDQRKPFPEPFVVLATDETGNPLPLGTEILFTPQGAECAFIVAPLDANGFGQLTCLAGDIPLGVASYFAGEMTASVLGNPGLGAAKFNFTVSTGSNGIAMDIVSGNMQTARTGEAVPAPLVFTLSAPFGGVGQSLIGIELEQIVGSGAIITPSFLAIRRETSTPVGVILGPAAGPVVIRARALAPKSPSVDFMIQAEGGVPARFEIEGDQQSGRIGRTLDNPLRMRVFNELGQVIAFPLVSWTVISGDASLLTGSDPDGATAVVSLGTTPGQISIQAKIGSLTAMFNATAAPTQVATIDRLQGLGQVLQVGMVSGPLVVEVKEPGGDAAFGAFIDFSGPPHVELLSLADTPAVGNPLRLQADQSGRAGVRVRLLNIPRPKGAANNILITASVGGGPTTVFAISVLGRDPVFQSAGIVNAATFASGVVPGSLVTIFGVGLSEGVAGTVSAGGATTFAGTTVKFGGIEAPLLSITNNNGIEQINLQAPFGLLTGQTTSVEINNNGSSLVVQSVPVFSAQPGIFEVPLGGGATGGAVADALSFQLITPNNPAEEAQPLAVFFTGGGSISPAVGTGVRGPAPPAVTTLPAQVTVDGQQADVLFSGYAPGFFGLFQVNFVVPGGVNCGTRSLVVRIGDSGSPVSTINLACP